MNRNDQTFGEYLLSLGVITHFGMVTGENSSMLACNHNSRKVTSITDNWNNVTCRQCKRILSRWKVNPELANQFRFDATAATTN
jgi:hypothetical protein